MNISIFSRLVTGFLVIFILAMTVSIYAIIQLSHLENVTKSILAVDYRLIEYEQKMSDHLLSMMRYEKKFVILKDEELYNNYQLSKNSFNNHLEQALPLANTDRSIDIINNIRNSYQHYLALFDTEAMHLRSGTDYSADNFKKEKESSINGLIRSLRELRNYAQQSTYIKVRKVGEAEVNSSNVAIIIGMISLVLGVVISIFITITITKPLAIIKKKTREIAKGNFGDDLTLSSPPEIRDLACSFNTMCSKLKEIDTLKSDFFSTMSHELRTPLTTIKEGTNLFLEALAESEATENQKRLLTIINEECIRLINLVNSLLDLSKMEAGMMAYNFTKADMSTLISKITREIEPLATTKKIEVHTEIQSGLPPVKIDCARILHVLRNLIGNALKFTPVGGQVNITALANGNELNVSVSDTGRGINKDNLTVIFNKYHQTDIKNKGTGLGLFIVKHIIDAHGGKVWVKDTSERGTTFSFVLPL